MNIKKLSRKQKESLYIKEETKLQKHWGNPIDSNWEYIKDWSNNKLEERINSVIGQLKFEKFFCNLWLIIKIIIGTIIIIFFLFSNLTPGTKTAIIIGFFLYLNFLKKNKQIEKTIDSLSNDTWQNKVLLQNNIIKKTSYKIDIVIEPNWFKIITKLATENKTIPQKFMSDIKKDKNLNIEKGLFNNFFRFVYFYDGISNLEQIWSDYEKTFIDEIKISGQIFKSKTEDFFVWSDNEKYKNNNVKNNLIIKPDMIGLSNNILPDNSIYEELSSIPFWNIIRFFINLHKNIDLCGPMYKIKKFPQNITQNLKKNNIKYDDWDYEDWGLHTKATKNLIDSEWLKKNNTEVYNQIMNSQIFTSPFYAIRFKIQIFD